MAERYLIDTSAVIKYLNESLPESGLDFIDQALDTDSSISFITEVELQVWDTPDPKNALICSQFIAGSFIHGIDNALISETIRIRKESKVKLPDAFIAATAIIHDLTLIADNDKDFLKVPGLKYVNPTSL